MKKIILILSVLLLTGCYSYEEINNLKIINGIYIDYKDDKYIGTFDIDKDIKVTGSNINELFRNFENEVPLKAYYPHLKVLIISSEILKSHFDEIIEFFLRNNEIRNNFYLAISDDITKLKSKEIRSMIKNSELVVSSSLFINVLRSYLDKYYLVIPFLENNGENVKVASAIIKNKNKIYKLSEDETRILKIISNRKPYVIYKNLYIYKSKTKKKNNNMYVSIDAELKGKSNKSIKKELKKDIEKLMMKLDKDNYKVKLKIDINRRGQILKYEQKQ